MTKKLAVISFALLLLVGSGYWLATQSNADASAGLVAAGVEQAELHVPTKAQPVAELVVRDPVAVGSNKPTTDDVHPDPGFAALVVRLRWSQDDSPASSVAVRALPQPGSYVHECSGLTDDEGEVVLRRIRPGRCWLVSSFTSLEQVDLVAGEVL